MGKLKQEALQAPTEDIQQHKLTDGEMSYLRLLKMLLQFNVHQTKALSGFLYYIASNRLGYKDGVNLQFEIDLDKPESMLTVKLLPEELTNSPTPPTANA